LAKRKKGATENLYKRVGNINYKKKIMKPTEIKKQKLMLNKKSISNLTSEELEKINGGVVTNPTTKQTLLETIQDCPCTHFCQPQNDTL
jgi:hypothetical protein